MPPVGFEPTISAGERPKTYALDRAATGTGVLCCDSLVKFPDGSFATAREQKFSYRTAHSIFKICVKLIFVDT